MYNRKKIAV